MDVDSFTQKLLNRFGRNFTVLKLIHQNITKAVYRDKPHTRQQCRGQNLVLLQISNPYPRTNRINQLLCHDNYTKTFTTRLNYKCPVGFNAAEYYISLLGVQIDKEFESRERIRRICDEYQRSSFAVEIERRVDVTDEDEYFNGTTDEKVSLKRKSERFICENR